MARCTDCIHYDACLRFADLRVILCGDEADTKCVMFKPTADVKPRAEVAREIFEELKRYIINHCYIADDDVDAIWKHIDKLKKKYTEED